VLAKVFPIKLKDGNQAGADAHTGSAAYRELIAGEFANLIVEFVEIDHELLVSL
jgi:hypothetical protein